MSVDFSWHLDEDLPPEPEHEEPQSERSRRRWFGRALLILIIVLLAAAALGYGYYYRQQQQLIAEFQRVLDQEVTFWQVGKYDSPQVQLVLDTERWDLRKGNYALLGFWGVTMLPMVSPLPTLRVSKVELHSDIAWVWIEWEDEEGRYTRVHFYRRVDGLWKRTVPDERFWGKQESIEGTVFRWTFYERDAPYVRPLADWADQMGQTVAGDFSLSEPPPMRIWLTYEMEKILFSSLSREDERRFPALHLLRIRRDNALDKLYQTLVAWAYVDYALEKVAPSHPPTPASPYPSSYYAFRSAVLLWETARLAMPLWKEIPGFYVFDPDAPPSLEDLFGIPRSPMDGDPQMYVVSLAFFIGDRYGPTNVIALLKQLQETPSFRRALVKTLGPDIDLETFEQEWHAYLRAHADTFRSQGSGK